MPWFPWRKAAKRPAPSSIPDAPHCHKCGEKTIPLVGLLTPTTEYRLRLPTGVCRGCEVITTDLPAGSRQTAPDAATRR